MGGGGKFVGSWSYFPIVIIDVLQAIVGRIYFISVFSIEWISYLSTATFPQNEICMHFIEKAHIFRTNHWYAKNIFS